MNATTCSIDSVAANRTVQGPEDHPRVRSYDMVSARVKRLVKVWRICRVVLERAALHLTTAATL
jgi:hypothetical protein